MRRPATAIAAIALLAGAAYAQGSDKGNENANRGAGRAAEATMRGGDNAAPASRANRDQGASMAATMRGSDAASGNAMRENRGAGNAMREGTENPERAREDRGNPAAAGTGNRVEVNPASGGRDDAGRAMAAARRDSPTVDRGDRDRDRARDFEFVRLGRRGPIEGCPPGLAKKDPRCVPPGQVRTESRLFAYDRPDWWGLTRLGSGQYLYDDGYLLRLGSDGRIGGFIPLLGGALAPGSLWPSFYEPVPLPDYFVEYYDLGPYESYRYADDVIYRVDPETAAITSVVALLTGDEFAVGQPMPAGYDIYNVPWDYRERYHDTSDAWYRYADGYIYRVDPETRLIAAEIELLAS